ncbi:hypothetical protein [Melittangium boletus]|uniref:hypothetical protein n=1 Tax=Melittangium boletus TaxID=83453 RepID=UPI003DA4A1A4
MKVSTALQLSWKSWPGHVGQVALESFGDPAFILTLIGVTTIYVGLWLTPDPTMLTKVLAGMLTLTLLAQFAWEDIYGLAKAWHAMANECARAKTQAELQAAGDAFAKKAGQVGFDILLFLVMWRAGKQVQPKLQRLGVERELARAEARVETAAAQPGSGRVQPAQAEASRVLDGARARTSANNPTPTHILDALSHGLSESARRGLSHLRKQLGDTRALVNLESALHKGGKDLDSHLSNMGVPPAEIQRAQSALLAAQKDLARIRLMAMKTLWDPALRQTAEAEVLQYFARLLRALKTPLDWELIQESIHTRNTTNLVAVLGEALQRSLLAEQYPDSNGYRIFSNVEVVREVKGVQGIADWQALERASGRETTPRGLYEKDGKLWRSITEIDALVTQKGLNGKWHPVELEQVKTGTHDQPVRAAEQNARALQAPGDLFAGHTDIRLYDHVSKNKLGKELTPQMDLSSLQEAKTATRGPPRKGFDRDLPFLKKVLEQVASTIVRQGLPPEQPSTLAPLPHGQATERRPPP